VEYYRASCRKHREQVINDNDGKDDDEDDDKDDGKDDDDSA
jgi:hypothetical protein